MSDATPKGQKAITIIGQPVNLSAFVRCELTVSVWSLDTFVTVIDIALTVKLILE
jgi:hypothetical protein